MTQVSVNAAALNALVLALANVGDHAQNLIDTAKSDDQLELALDGSGQANEAFMAEREELKADLEVAELELRQAQNERDAAIEHSEKITAQLVGVALFANSLQHQLNSIGISWGPSEYAANTAQVLVDPIALARFLQAQVAGA